MELFEQQFAADRRHTDCFKWDSPDMCAADDGFISMWVADMDFKSPTAVQEALQARVDHGVFGYYLPPDSYYQAFIDWERERHGYEVKREWIRFSPGVVMALYWFVQMMTDPGDACVILTPVYYPFSNAVLDNGRKLVCCDLVNTEGVYTIDYDKFERAIITNSAKLFLLCSPHNPVGRVWTEDELRNLLGICNRHNVFVVSDEIHQDILPGRRKHVPAAMACDGGGVAMLTSASKTFNLAGCSNSFVILPGERDREMFDRFTRAHHPFGGNLFGYIAAEAAYRGGREWLDRIHDIVRWNHAHMNDVFCRELPGIVASPLEGTYLAWYDFSAYVPDTELEDVMKYRCRLAVDYGHWFGEAGRGYVRINLATPRKYVEEAAQRIVTHVKEYGGCL